MAKLTKEMRATMTKGEARLYRLGYEKLVSAETTDKIIYFNEQGKNVIFDLTNKTMKVDGEFNTSMIRALTIRMTELNFTKKEAK